MALKWLKVKKHLQPSALAKKILRPQSPSDTIDGYRQAVMRAPDISEVYQHYRGENLPDDQFLRNTVVETYKVPSDSFQEFKQVFLESLETAELVSRHGEKIRITDVASGDAAAPAQSDRLKKLEKATNVGANDSCFVMQPFAGQLGEYYLGFRLGEKGKTGTAYKAKMSLKAGDKPSVAPPTPATPPPK